MHRITKNTLLKYIPKSFIIEKNINTSRIYQLNNNKITNGYIIYLCEREIRAKDNFALQFALQKSIELNSDLKIIHPAITYTHKPKQDFIDKQIYQAKRCFQNLNIDFTIIPSDKTIETIKKLHPSLVITDFNPISKKEWLYNISSRVYEIDGHNIIPSRFVSTKQEYNAATFRRKIYYNIYPFLTEFDNLSDEEVEADFILKDFIKNKLNYYYQYKNDPQKNVTSELSKYLNLGFISAQRIAIEIIKSDTENFNKEAFLEELIIRKELADNFCLYSKSYKNFSSIPQWARLSLNIHNNDFRTYIYKLKDLKLANTHDNLWNATQIQLLKEGTINGYLRMYWAKKVLEWTNSAQEALEYLIYLNDKYAYDAPSSNGYVGILWSIGGLHDRAFTDYPVTGKIRRMTYNSLTKKYKLQDYINKYY